MKSNPEPVPEKRHAMTIRLKAIVALQKATDMIGQGRMADALGVAARTVRSYLSVERRLDPKVLEQAAVALEIRADELSCHAAKLRILAHEARS